MSSLSGTLKVLVRVRPCRLEKAVDSHDENRVKSTVNVIEGRGGKSNQTIASRETERGQRFQLFRRRVLGPAAKQSQVYCTVMW